MAHAPRLREMRATLSDLESQILDQTDDLQQALAQSKRSRLALVALLTALLALGVWMAWRAS